MGTILPATHVSSKRLARCFPTRPASRIAKLHSPYHPLSHLQKRVHFVYAASCRHAYAFQIALRHGVPLITGRRSAVPYALHTTRKGGQLSGTSRIVEIGTGAPLAPQRLRRQLLERLSVVFREPPEMIEPELRRNLRDGRGPGVGGEQRPLREMASPSMPRWSVRPMSAANSNAYAAIWRAHPSPIAKLRPIPSALGQTLPTSSSHKSLRRYSASTRIRPFVLLSAVAARTLDLVDEMSGRGTVTVTDDAVMD